MALFDFGDTSAQERIDFDSYDATVIGCGAVGIFIAVELSKRGMKVLILESGGEGEKREFQSLNTVEANRADVKSSAEWGRKRALGGTTIKWGGQALPFGSIDFEQRPWLGVAAWPIDMSDLLEHYKKAEEYLGVDDLDYFKDTGEVGARDPLCSKAFVYHLSKWAPEPNMFKKYRAQSKRDFDVLFHAHCIGVRKTEGEISHLEIANSPGESFWLPVKKVFLASGGLESVRFLLLHFPGISSHLGKGFMEHPCMTCAHLKVSDSFRLQQHFATRYFKRRKYGIRLSLSDAFMRQERLANASFSLMFETSSDAFDPYREATSLFSLFKRGIGLANVKSLISALKTLVMEGWVYRPNASVRLAVMAEQINSSSSVLCLSESTFDQFAQPILKVDWQISEHTRRTIDDGAKVLLKELESKFPEIESVTLNTLANKGWQESLSSVNHHMGGAAIEKVVDDHMQLRDFKNFYVCSSSVFPSSSHSNPTLTALALTSRTLESFFA